MGIQSLGFPSGAVVKNPPANARDTGDAGSIPGSGRSPGGGNGNPLQYSCLENSMDREAWQASPWGPKESDTTERLNFHFPVTMETFVLGPHFLSVEWTSSSIS